MDGVPELATRPTLQGTLVTLRPFRDGDVEVMAQILSDPDVRRLTGSVELNEFDPRARRVHERVGYVVTGAWRRRSTRTVRAARGASSPGRYGVVPRA